MTNYLTNSVRTTKIEQQGDSGGAEKRNVILGPDGEVSRIGVSLNRQLAELQRERPRDERERQRTAVYKLEEGGVPPPYLYFSNKLAGTVDVEYGNLLDKPFGKSLCLCEVPNCSFGLSVCLSV